LYVIGLGNPEEKYKYNRHNVAWLILDALNDGEWSHHKYMNADISTNHYGLYIKPQTFMNHSGQVVDFLKSEVDFKPEHLVIIYDDIDLAFGTIRVSHDRGDGGHNGLKSIVEHLGSKECIRVRIGVSRLLADGRLIKPNVLGNFPPNEKEEISELIAPQVEKIIKSLVDLGLEKTMNIFNVK